MGLAGWVKTDRCGSFSSDLALLLIATGFSGKNGVERGKGIRRF
jgi:hypothetical protein